MDTHRIPTIIVCLDSQLLTTITLIRFEKRISGFGPFLVYFQRQPIYVEVDFRY